MRLIDAESLSSMRFTHKMHDSEGRLYVPFDEVAEAIFNAPTIEADPVKHGRWECEIRNTIDGLHTYQQFRCSVCGMTYITNTPYCPNCGAKMEGEEA